MVIVGLTGNVAAGKSTVAELWRDAGVPVASADRLARTAVEPGSAALAEIVDLFGTGVLNEDGSLDRAAVRRRVFRDEEALRSLEAIVHPEVRRLRDQWTEDRRAEGAPLVVWEIPLLFETGMETEVDVVIVVDAPEDVRRRRIVETRDMTQEEAEAVMAAQQPAEAKRSRADIVLNNGEGRAALVAAAAQVLQGLRSRSARR
ncbi:MAG: dephospho-CoA kinase [Gemmatimonadetes bacterium]|nr:dephospho-CoA kinase [Gemmatimonadota bacterium]